MERENHPTRLQPIEIQLPSETEESYPPIKILWQNNKDNEAPLIVIQPPDGIIDIALIVPDDKTKNPRLVVSQTIFNNGLKQHRWLTPFERANYIRIAQQAIKLAEQTGQIGKLPPDAQTRLQELEEQIQLSLASQRLQQALGIYYVEPGSQTPRII